MTYYLYDASDRLVRVCQSGTFDLQNNCQGGQGRQFAYDQLGRLTDATNPEASTGAQTSGTTHYTYDNNGNVNSKRDARFITATMNYDALNRMVTKSTPIAPRL